MTDAANGLRVVVVILAYNGGEKTASTIQSLVDAGEDAKVLLWDNGSDEDVAGKVKRRFPQVLVYRNPVNLGVASGRNAAAALAIRHLAPTHLLFLDNDMLVRPGFVQGLLYPFLSDERVGQTQAKLLLQHDPTRLNDGGGCRIRFWLGSTEPVGFNEVDRGQRDQERDCVACGGAMMVKTDIFNDLGGFDSVFNPFGPEDLDFSLRLRKRGYRAVYAPRAVALHAVSGTFDGGKESPVYTQKRISNWLRLLRRHSSPYQQAAFFLIGAPYRIGSMVLRALRSGNPGILLGMIGSIRGLWRAAESSNAGVGPVTTNR